MIDRLIKKLYYNLASGQEVRDLLSLLQDEQSVPDESSLKELWYKLPQLENLSEQQSDKIFSRLQKKKSSYPKSVPSKKINLRIFLKYAVAASIALLVGSFVYFMIDSFDTTKIKTAYGEQKAVILPDGSHVQLNANTTITFKKDWNADLGRSVSLEGEAYFEVIKKPETGQKFEVVTNDLAVEVMGTTFNVNTHNGKTKVFLAEGLVTLNLINNQELKMNPGELVTYNKNDRIVEKKLVDSAQISWKHGIVTFKNETLGHVVTRLQEIYRIDVVIDDKRLYETKISTGVPIDNLNLAMSVLSKTSNLVISIEGKKVIIKSK